MKERETNIDSLPNELLFDILVRLPADFLRDTARLVCSTWCQIIRSNAFINTQIEQYSTYGLVLSFPSLNELKHPHSIYVTATQGRIETSELSCIRTKEIIATSCDGLALELNGDSLHVINPATKQSFLLPSISTHNRYVYHHLSGIAYCAASMECKVTLPYFDYYGDQSTYLDIVTVGVDKSWRRVEVSPLPEHIRSVFYLDTPVSSEGFLHWGSERYCLTLNVETEMITTSESPIPPYDQLYPFSYNYLSTGRYITLLVRRRKFCWEVWEMRPAESGEWTKVMPNIDLEYREWRKVMANKGDLEWTFLCEYLHPVGWVKYPEVLALRFGRLLLRTCILYNLETHEIDTVELSYRPNHSYSSLVHRNSLVRLTQD